MRYNLIDSSGVGHKDCPHRPLHTPSTPPVQQQHQLTLAPQATLRLTGGVPGKVGLHQTTYVCSVYFFITLPYNCCYNIYIIEVDTNSSFRVSERRDVESSFEGALRCLNIAPQIFMTTPDFFVLPHTYETM